MRGMRTLWLIVVVFTISLAQSYASSEITFHRVGEGNCTTIAVKQEDGSKKYMIIDCGSREFAKTLNTYPDINTSSTSTHVDTPPIPQIHSVPLSTMKQYPTIATSGDNIHDQKKAAIESIRETLLTKKDDNETKSSISVKTIVISHPDTDHYNWIWDILNSENDTLENIVLGGRPEKYLSNSDFEKWLTGWLNKKNKKPNIFFLAIKNFSVTIDDLSNLKLGIYKLSPSLFSNPDKTEFNLTLTRLHDQKPMDLPANFKEAFNFGSKVLFHFLTVNPVHIPSNIEKDKYIRLSYSSEESNDIDNQDSLVMKMINIPTGKSVVITGDATALTMEKVFSNYNENELKTDILLASHHGANTWGSNNKKLFEKLKPTCVIFSNGQHLGYRHPREEAYDNAKISGSIGHTEIHEITRYKKTEKNRENQTGVGGKENKGQYFTYETTRAIFSTFDNGSIYISLPDEKDDFINIKAMDNFVFSEKYYLINNEKKEEKNDKIKRILIDLSKDDPILFSPKSEKQQVASGIHTPPPFTLSPATRLSPETPYRHQAIKEKGKGKEKETEERKKNTKRPRSKGEDRQSGSEDEQKAKKKKK